MSGEDWPRILFLALALILPLAALQRRQIKLSRGLMMVGAWIAIFAVAAWIFATVRGTGG